jgi:acid phosphatase (class B)
MLKNVRAKAEQYWTTTKKLTAAASVWGLIFSLVTITHLGVAFDYDDTLVHSAAAFSKAFAQTTQPYTPEFWAVVNQNYDLEKPKLFTYPLAWAFRLFGFKVTVMTSRPPVGAEPLKKEWRHLLGRGNFVFTNEHQTKQSVLNSGNYVLYFGDSDSDIQEARRAKVFPVRIRRSNKSMFKEDYHPGTLGELVVPFSEY